MVATSYLVDRRKEEDKGRHAPRGAATLVLSFNSFLWRAHPSGHRVGERPGRLQRPLRVHPEVPDHQPAFGWACAPGSHSGNHRLHPSPTSRRRRLRPRPQYPSRLAGAVPSMMLPTRPRAGSSRTTTRTTAREPWKPTQRDRGLGAGYMMCSCPGYVYFVHTYIYMVCKV